jgi:S1-C subfamily serine protease
MLNKLKVAVVTLSLTFALGMLAVSGSQIHTKIIRATVTDKIGYVIVPFSGRDMQGRVTEGRRSQGTGFDITLPSGKTAILTNRHVCAPSKDGVVYIVRPGDSIQHQRKIIDVSQTSDLCLVEPISEASSALKLASSFDLGDHVISVGHPAGLPLMPSYGEAVAVQTIPVLSEMYPVPLMTEADVVKAKEELKPRCSKQNQQLSLEEINFLGLPIKLLLCIDFNTALLTTTQILGGSSGSPLFNIWGNVVGVMFAGSSEHNNWGYAIPLQSVKEFLNGR